MSDATNPTKKQKIMLDFIDSFVRGRGYSPTLREIMQALDYKSVSTVAKHVDNLIVRGWLVKRDGQARSLEVIDPNTPNEKPWWSKLEAEITKREYLDTQTAQSEAEVLRRALEIVKS